MNIPIEDITYVLGRGQVVVCRFPDDMFHYIDDHYIFDMHVGDKVKVGNESFEIRRIEQLLKIIGMTFDHDIPVNTEFIEI